MEQCQTTLNGLTLWRSKDVPLTIDNWKDHIFALSTDIATYFGMRHNNFLNQNIHKLRQEGYLPDQVHRYKQLIAKGKSALVPQTVYALNSKEIGVVAASLSAGKFYEKKLALLIHLQEIDEDIFQIIEQEYVIDNDSDNPADYPLLTDVLELYETTDEGTQLWKTNGVSLNLSNVLDNVFALSINLARFFSLRHSHLINRNIIKLQKEGYLPDHLHKIVSMIPIGKGARKPQVLYALTRHETNRVIMDLVGPKAREKKYQIVERLEQLEIAILQGAYQQATARALDWDGAALLKEFGFKFSLEQENIATRKDILDFLQLPSATLTNFLQRNSQQISPIKLNREQRLAAGSNASRLYGYSADDVAKTIFWLDSRWALRSRKRCSARSRSMRDQTPTTKHPGTAFFW